MRLSNLREKGTQNARQVREVKEGNVAEHWHVMQEEVPASRRRAASRHSVGE
jgi:hypothetical protein